MVVPGGPGAGSGRIGPDHTINRRPLQQPLLLFLRRMQRLSAIPWHIADSHLGHRFCNGLSDDSEKIAVTKQLERAERSTVQCRFIDRGDGRAAAWLTDHSRVPRAACRIKLCRG